MDIFDKVREILCDQLDLDESTVNEDSNIVEDLGADSLDSVDIILALEDEFDIQIPDEETENIKTVGDLCNYVEKLRQ